jgi:hypothetical protein
VDESIDKVGADCVDDLGEHLATSAILIPILSKDYFGSDWCLHELDLMLGRTEGAPPIIPIDINASDSIPDRLKRVQPAQFDKYRIACLCEGTPLYQEFSIAVKGLAPPIAQAVDNAPPCELAWIKQHQQRFKQVFEAQLAGQTLEPRQFTARRPAPPIATPRLY